MEIDFLWREYFRNNPMLHLIGQKRTCVIKNCRVDAETYVCPALDSRATSVCPRAVEAELQSINTLLSSEIVSHTGTRHTNTFEYSPNSLIMQISTFVPQIKPSVNVQSSEILQAIQSQDFWCAVNDSNLFPDLPSKIPSKLQICSIQEVRSISMRRTGWSTNSILVDLSNNKFVGKFFSLLYNMI